MWTLKALFVQTRERKEEMMARLLQDNTIILIIVSALQSCLLRKGQCHEIFDLYFFFLKHTIGALYE